MYTYDPYQRVIQIARGTVTNGNFVEDTTQRTYAYEGTNGGFSSSTAGRVSQIQYSGPDGLSFTEMYNYLPAGAVTTKRLQTAGTPFGGASINLDANYSYNNEGQVTSISYPVSQYINANSTTAGPTYNYSYDTMARLSGMSDNSNTNWVSSVTYGPANQMLQMVANSFTESRTYNANLELTELTSGTNVDYRYSYPSGTDDGQIASQTDVISGEVTTYQYDSLQRLISASATGDPSGSWSQAFTYDGFGNLTQKSSTNAPALSVAVDPATNRILPNASYDANGNMTGYSGATYGYDLQNRMVQASASGGGFGRVWLRFRQPSHLQGRT